MRKLITVALAALFAHDFVCLTIWGTEPSNRVTGLALAVATFLLLQKLVAILFVEHITKDYRR